MWNNLQNIAVFLVFLSALVLFIAGKRNKYFFLALGLLLIVSILIPFVGLLLAGPVALLVWMDHSPAVWAKFESMKGVK
jgi:hypothetical protein